jgi:serine protease Do
MDEVPREACPRCAEPTSLAARVCPFCRGPLLVDVVAERIPDAGRRYRFARDIAKLGPPFLSFARAQELLKVSGGILAEGVTRQTALQALAAARENGATARVQVSEPGDPAIAEAPWKPPATSRLRERLLFGIPLAVTGALLWLALGRPSPSPPHSPAKPSPSPAIAEIPTARALPPARSSPREIAAKAIDSTATVRCESSSGSGFFVAPDLLVTNDHVLCPSAGSIEISLHDGRTLPGTAESRDNWLDLALVRVPGAAARPLSLGDGVAVAAGESCLMIGTPIGMDFTVTQAIVSRARRNVFGIAYIQFDANVNPGNSGGPLLDSQGRAIGVVSMMIADSRGLGLALPVNYLYEISSSGVPLPIPAPDFAGWRLLLREVHEQDDREAAQARASFRKPALGAAALNPSGEIYVFLLARGLPAGATPLRFDLFRGERLLCPATAIVETWDPFGSGHAERREDARRARWLQKIGLGAELYLGNAALRLDACPDPASLLGAMVVLRDGEPGADRAIVRPFRLAS